jgi:hypothetical protein
MIPKVFHFIFGLAPDFGGKPFSFFHYVAVRSALCVHPGWKAIVHYQYEPSGPYWRATRDIAEAHKVEAPTEVFGNPLLHYAHRSDVLRLQILQEYGGVYLDMDTICVRPLDDLCAHDALLGMETCNGKEQGLCNAVILAAAGAAFIQKWLGAYRTFRSKGHDKYWCEHSVQVPAKLARAHPDLCRILPPTAFFSPDWSEEGLQQMFLCHSAFPHSYLHHLWEFVAWKHLCRFNECNIFRLESTYARLARSFFSTTDSERLLRYREEHGKTLIRTFGKKINLGCGSRPLAACLNIDFARESNADLFCDLEREIWPIPDDSVEEAFVHHVLEYMSTDLEHFLRELYRVCRDGAVVDVRLPGHAHDSTITDSADCRAFHPDALAMLDRVACTRAFMRGYSKTPLALYWNIDFVTVSVECVLVPRARRLAKVLSWLGLSRETVSPCFRSFYDATHVVLRVRKGNPVDLRRHDDPATTR